MIVHAGPAIDCGRAYIVTPGPITTRRNSRGWASSRPLAAQHGWTQLRMPPFTCAIATCRKGEALLQLQSSTRVRRDPLDSHRAAGGRGKLPAAMVGPRAPCQPLRRQLSLSPGQQPRRAPQLDERCLGARSATVQWAASAHSADGALRKRGSCDALVRHHNRARPHRAAQLHVPSLPSMLLAKRRTQQSPS